MLLVLLGSVLLTAPGGGLLPGAAHFKKGVGGGGNCGDLDKGGLDTVTWWYDWGHDANGFAQCNGTSPLYAEYVPMIWGKWATSNVTATVADIRKLGKVRYLFGFNEPDHSGSWEDPVDAAKRWPNMERIADALNVTLISPCVSNYQSGLWWLDTFRAAFKNATGRSPRMEHMCLHAYTSDAKSVMNTLEAMNRTYNRPIWVNEFACPPYKGCTSPNQLKFMKAILPLLEESPLVYRYAWFDQTNFIVSLYYMTEYFINLMRNVMNIYKFLVLL